MGAETAGNNAGGRLLKRGRFLALVAGGGVLGWAGTRVFGGAVGGWRYNTVEVPVPAFERGAYRLVIDGLVEQGQAFSYDELRALPAVRQVSDFHCVEGWGVPDVQWDGVRLQTLMERVRPLPEAGFVTFHSLGGIYRDSLTIEQARLPDVLVAYDMAGAPLEPEHGLPLRLVMPRMYGYKGPKWVTRIEFRDRRDIGYWEERGWRIEAWLKS